jgi:hypothetical protein
MHSNQNWPPVITALGVYLCFRNATRAEQGCCRDLQGHTVFFFNGWEATLSEASNPGYRHHNRSFDTTNSHLL